jgi:single-strand DNA-binding protein
MPKSVNKVILVGNVGQDPDIRYTPSAVPVAKFRFATNERFKDKSGAWQDRVEWHNLIAWQRLAEIVGEYVKQGSKLYIEGRLQTSSWEDRQTGEKKYRTEIVVRDLVLLSGRPASETEGPPSDARESTYEPEEACSGGHPRPGYSVLDVRAKT